MPSTLQHTRPSSMPWEAIKPASITLLPLVCTLLPPSPLMVGTDTRKLIATSGAAATIASDAFMNPFDGMCIFPSFCDRALG